MAIANAKIKMIFLTITFSAQFSLLPNKEDQKPNSQSTITSILSYVTQKIYSNRHIFCLSCIFNPNRIYDQLAHAIINNDTEKITFLIKKRGIHPDDILFDEKTSSLQIPLSLAARSGAVKSLKTLIQLGADVNKQLVFNIKIYPTPLIESCAYKNQNPKNVEEIVTILLFCGANPTVETDCYSGIHPLTCYERELIGFKQKEKKAPPPKTVFDLAQENNYTETAIYLKTILEALSSNKALKLR